MKHLQLLRNEIEVQREVDHPCFLKLLEVYEDQESVYLINEELEGGTLLDIIKARRTHFKGREVRTIMRRLWAGLEYLHALGFIHRDIKLENVMFQEKGKFETLRIIDFGLVVDFVGGSATEHCGTPGYIAPEVMAKNKI